MQKRTWLIVAALVVLASCHSDSNSAVGRRTGEIAKSPSLNAALNGAVIEPPGTPPGGQIAAGTAANASVGDDGSTTYRIPIWVPAGMAGLQPALAVEYNSEAGTGLLGPRWRLSGLSAITRCQQTLALDGIQRPVDYTTSGDTFCLDGERLIRISGTPGTAGDFRSERDPFARIQMTIDASGIPSFQVNQSNGWISYYGRTSASRLQANPTNFQSGTTMATTAYAFYLDKIADRYNNSILIAYQNQLAGSSSQAQELVPTTITYGGTGDGTLADTVGLRTVTFGYQPNPASGPDSGHLRWKNGLGIFNGQLLTSLTMAAPADQSFIPAVLKVYNFTYQRPTITGEQLLTTISECDGAGVCKRPTTISWEPGSWASTRTVLNVPNSSDLLSAALSCVPANNVCGDYRRIIAADLNNDGRDDIVYRSWSSGGGVSWSARLASSDGASFGLPITLSAGADSAPAGSGTIPYAGDLVIADLNRDGYPDIISPKGTVSTANQMLTPSLTRYFAYLNTTTPAGGLSFGSAIDFEDSTVAHGSPFVAVGDIDGDGIPEVVRTGGLASLWAADVASTGVTVRSMPNMFPLTLGGFALLDIDGDGTAEVLRDVLPFALTFPFGQPGAGESVSSPTMNGHLNVPPSLAVQAGVMRWFLDLNGDGLTDVAYVMAATPTVVQTLINTGQSLYSGDSVTLPASQAPGQAWLEGGESGARVVDANMDGRQDLLLVDNGAVKGQGQTRSNVVLLTSTGHGLAAPGGALVDGAGNPIPLGLPVRSPLFYGTFGDFNWRTSVVLDFNGDGLPDLMQIENGAVVVYIRQGKAPDMVTMIREGGARRVAAQYAPLNDSTVYTSNPSTCASDPQHLECLVRGRWLTKSLSISGKAGGPLQGPATQTFTYANGLSDKGGRGFLGFTQRDIYGPSPTTRHTTVTYNPQLVSTIRSGYFYPFAFEPAVQTALADTFQGTYTRHKGITGNNYTVSTPVAGTYSVEPSSITQDEYDCVPSGTGCGSTRFLSEVVTHLLFDNFGNRTFVEADYNDLNALNTGVPLQADMEQTTYAPPDTTNWLVSRPSYVQTSSSTPTEGSNRATKYTTDASTGAITSIEIEPPGSGDATMHLLRCFVPDGRGRLSTVTDQTTGTCGSPPTDARTTTFTYEDADGIYPATITNALNQPTHIYRHPGLGLVVEVDDPNSMAATRKYDTFGRVLVDTAITGASTSFAYEDTVDPNFGVTVHVFPEFRTSREITITSDSFGNEVTRSQVLDANGRTLYTYSYHDNFGRLAQRITTNTAVVGDNQLSNETFSFDDLNRMTGKCSLTSSDGQIHCATNSFDGLQITSTDESGRTVTRIADAMGRLSIERAVLGTTGGGTQASDATYSYGPFGLLEVESVADGSGRTETHYDLLGRPITTTRAGAGTRGTTYNGYGEVVSTFKQAPDNTQSDSLSYTRDKLGRLRTIRGFGVTRTLNWDSGGTGPAIGKLVDAHNGANDVHFDYDSATGLPSAATWTASMFGNPAAQLGTAGFAYDSEGRLSTLTYPAPSGQTPLVVNYGYDNYLGTTTMITDMTVPSTPKTIWSVTSRNELGQVATESLAYANGASPGAPVTRSRTYYLQDGRINTATISGTSTQAQLQYTYQHDGLPATLSMSGAGGSWTSTFDYDNLGRLTSWTPSVGAPTVSYLYDGDGNMTSRQWQGETATYAATSTSRTLTVTRGTQVTTDTYQMDLWGRVFDTPAATLGYNSADEIVSVTEKNGNVSDAIIRDGLGNRIATTYGSQSAGPYSYLLTLGELYEYRYQSSDNSFEERCHLLADGAVIGDIVRTTATAPNRTASFYLTDTVGSVVAEASSAGTVTARARRDPFGNLLGNAMAPYLPADAAGTDPDGSSRLGYGGHERESNWGLIDMAARLYSPRLGRFLSPDPVIGRPNDRRAYNPFAYVWNRPTAMVDPDGRDPCDAGSESCSSSVTTGNEVGGVVVAAYELWTHRKDIWKGLKNGTNWVLEHVRLVGRPAGGAVHWVLHELKSGYCALIGWGCSKPSAPPAPPSPSNTNALNANVAQSPSTSPATGGTSNPARRTGSTENDGGLDLLVKDGSALTTGVLKEWAGDFHGRVTPPITFGEGGFEIPSPIDLSLNDVNEFWTLREFVQTSGTQLSSGLKAMQVIQGLDEGNTVLQTALEFRKAAEAQLKGDNATAAHHGLEGAFILSAARMGSVGMGAAFTYMVVKLHLLNAQQNVELSNQGKGQFLFPSFGLAATTWVPY
jgi:RHS repeat-associated protein